MKYYRNTYTPIVWHVGIAKYVGASSDLELILATPDMIFLQKLKPENTVEHAANLVAQLTSDVPVYGAPVKILSNDPELVLAMRKTVRWLDVSIEYSTETSRLDRIRLHLSRKAKNSHVVWRDELRPTG